MGQVSITIRGRQYQIACDDGQEAHLARLGRFLDQRAEQLHGSLGSVSDALLLVMTGLVVADELTDTIAELEAVKSASGNASRMASETAITASINTLAERIERIAAGLEDT
ncbi:MAG: cell division protein ZapA [Rhodospirillaceae bacterium]